MIIKILLTIFLYSLSLSAYSLGSSVFKSITDEVFFTQRLPSLISDQASQRVIKDNFTLGIQSFTPVGKVATLADIKSMAFIITDEADKKAFNEIIKVFESDISLIDSQKLSKTASDFALIAQRYGLNKVAALSCLKCADALLASKGFEYSLKSFQTSSHKQIYKRVLSKRTKPTDMKRYISQQIKSQNLGRVSKLLKHEESSLAFFLSIPTLKGDEAKSFKELYNSIVSLSTINGKVDLFSTKNPHKFWLMANEVQSVNEIKSLTRLLNQASKDMRLSNSTAKDSFLKIMSRKIKTVKNEKLKAKLEANYKQLSSTNCYF